MSRRNTNQRLALAVACAVVFAGSAGAAPPLEQVSAGAKADVGQISVSGISSGGFMAHQFHVAHSAHVMGAGIVAGGPYYCAEGSIAAAVTKCSQFVMLECKKLGINDAWCGTADLAPKTAGEIEQAAAGSFDEARRQEARGNISKLENLKNDQVYLFSGAYDSLVPQGVMDALFHFYTDADKAGLAPDNIHYSWTFPAPHTMVRDSFNKPAGSAVGTCAPAGSKSLSKSTFIDDCESIARQQQAQSSCICAVPSESGTATAEPCPPSDKQALCRDLRDVDLAGAILTRIYGAQVLTAGRVPVPGSQVQAFDQKKVFDKIAYHPFNARLNAAMAKEGYIFIPKHCRDGRSCRLHVAFHGCQQGGLTGRKVGRAGNLFSQLAGYNEWAQANDIIVLYPQVEPSSPTPMNPRGCWDWWGQEYTHEGYHTQRGKQIRAVAQMINILTGEPKLLDIPPE
ncbi:hypothetical protein THSYN_26535 [Candidatus Thiodictyon syntrophicum]|jgi:poly(3-hydroxybutyrate) depolymerase|uniref:Poly(3-hydroxybutyrate) depolymerase n=1 Tax=Candidatus Thiodictyon syntrophicum TaxID=1166950 RepID=A0A2K8UEY9_9GAMM|nr:hypothetical protein THSYN_26535 [Candidatus Thiodictyon syntrophicum]